MIASPENTSSQHIDILAELSSKLIDEGFIEQFKQCANAKQALQLMLQKPQSAANNPEANKGFIIGVTSQRSIDKKLTCSQAHPITIDPKAGHAK